VYFYSVSSLSPFSTVNSFFYFPVWYSLLSSTDLPSKIDSSLLLLFLSSQSFPFTSSSFLLSPICSVNYSPCVQDWSAMDIYCSSAACFYSRWSLHCRCRNLIYLGKVTFIIPVRESTCRLVDLLMSPLTN
jgi:hypothetical protein